MNIKVIAQSIIRIFVLVISLGGVATLAQGAIEVYEFDTPQQEAQYQGLIQEFRCPKCQNQNLAGSDSQIAQDLKRKTYEMVMAGQSDTQIREYMYERYGDFISYKPPVRPSTWLLWYFPPIFLMLIVGWWLWRTKSRQKSADLSPIVGDQVNQDAVYKNIGNSNTDNQSTFEASDHVSHEPTIDLDSVDSDLSEEESAKLKALLNKHDKSSQKD